MRAGLSGLLLALLALLACAPQAGVPTVARARDVGAEGGAMLSAAAWGGDSVAVSRAVDAAFDSVRIVDSLLSRGARASPRYPAGRALGVAPDSLGIVTGYALDRAALALAGVADSALLDWGGQFLWVGPATRRMVGIADPARGLRTVAAVEMRGGSVRTAADPDQARRGSVTVLARSGVVAGAWAEGLRALGCDRALALAPRLGPGVSLVCADSAGVGWSPELEGRVVLPTAPGALPPSLRGPRPAPAPARAPAATDSTTRSPAPGSSR